MYNVKDTATNVVVIFGAVTRTRNFALISFLYSFTIAAMMGFHL